MSERGFSRIGGQLSLNPSLHRTKNWRRAAVAAAVGSAPALLAGGSPAFATTDYWDGDGVGTVAGGPGQWDLTLPRWGASPSANTYAPFVNNDTAVFGGSGGTVNLAGALQGNLDIQSNGYLFELTSAGAGSFSWANPSASVNVATGVSTEFRLPITGATAGLVKTGGGAFGIANNALVTSQSLVTISEGTLFLARSGATLGLSPLTVAAGATFSLGKFYELLGPLNGSGTIVLGAMNNTQAATSTFMDSVWGSTLQLFSVGSSTFAGNIIDDGSPLPNAPFSGGHLAKSTVGTLTLTGTNTFRGPTLLSNGSLVLQNGSALPDTAPVFLTGSTTLVINDNESLGSLASTVTTGQVNLAGGTLTVGGDNLNNELAAALNGSGTIVKVGSGKQFLTGTSTTGTYTGKYVIQSGVFGFGADARLGVVPTTLTANYITLDGGTLQPQTAAAGANITLNANRGITLTANGGGIAYNNPAGNNLSIQGPISGSGTLTRSGAALVNLQGNNSGFTGKFLVTDGITNLGNGGVVFGNNSNLGSIPAGTASWDISQARLQLATNNTGTGIQTYTLASKPGGTFSYGPGVVMTIARGGTTNLTVTIGDPASGSSTLIRKPNGSLLINAASGPLNLGAATSEQILVNGGVPTVAINGGADTLVPGWILTTADGSNEGYFGTYDNSFGVQVSPWSLKTNINDANSTDQFEADYLSNNVMTANTSVGSLRVGITGTATTVSLGSGTLSVGSAISTDPATVLLNTASQIVATGAGGANFGNHEAVIATFGTSTWNGVITGSQGMTKMGYGTLVLSSTATLNYPGVTRIEQGTLNLGANNQLPTGTDLIFSGAPSTTAGANPTLVLNGRILNINSLNTANNANAIGTSAGGPVINIGANGLVKINGSGTSSFNGQITNGSGTSTVWNAGSGTLTLGIPNAISSDRSAVMSYNKLWVTNGGTVVLPISDFNAYPASAGTPLVDAFLLDNGTLSFPSILGIGIGADVTSLGGNFIINTSRGIRINSGGGTFDVQNPYQQISMAGNGPLSGTATMTKTGAGLLLLPSAASATSARLKLRVLGGDVIFPADTSLGPVPTALQTDNITLDNGAAIDASATMTLSANRGINIGAGGGELRQSTSGVSMNIAGPLSGSGALRISSPISGGTKVFTGISDGTGPGAPTPFTGTVTLAMDGAVYINAKNALGTGTITNDPSFPVIVGSSFAGAISLVNNFNVNAGRPWDWATNSGSTDLTLTGVISGAGDMYKGLNGATGSTVLGSPGTLTLANSANSFTGNLTITQGTLVPLVNGALGSTSANLVVNGHGSLALKGPINYASAKPLSIGASFNAINNVGDNIYAGPVSVIASSGIGVNGGTLTLTNDLVGAGSVITTDGLGRLTLKNIRTGGLTMSGGDVYLAPNGQAAGTSIIRHLLINIGRFNLEDNHLITSNPAGSWNGTIYTGVTGVVVVGKGGTANTWNGNFGIITRQTAAIGSNYTSIGVASAIDIRPNTATTTDTWAGQTITGTDTLVMYTYGGDATLDGKINIDDYVKTDAGISGGLTGWANGDFNYDGKVNIDDYTIIDANISTQGPAFFAASGVNNNVSGVTGVSAVPEPATAVWLATVALVGGMLNRRRRVENRDFQRERTGKPLTA